MNFKALKKCKCLQTFRFVLDNAKWKKYKIILYVCGITRIMINHYNNQNEVELNDTVHRGIFFTDVFPNANRGNILGSPGGQIDNIRKLRNRISHHEPILRRNLNRDYSNIIEVMNWIDPMLCTVNSVIDRFLTVNSQAFYDDLKLKLKP